MAPLVCQLSVVLVPETIVSGLAVNVEITGAGICWMVGNSFVQPIIQTLATSNNTATRISISDRLNSKMPVFFLPLATADSMRNPSAAKSCDAASKAKRLKRIDPGKR